jgi:hypothetical protein
MTKFAALFAVDRSAVADVIIGDDFYGYPLLVEYDARYFVFQDNRRGFQLNAVNSADYAPYLETTLYVVPVVVAEPAVEQPAVAEVESVAHHSGNIKSVFAPKEA